MGSRMQAPVHCEVCGDSSKNMAPSDEPETLEDYGMCKRCMYHLMDRSMHSLHSARMSIELLNVKYPAMEMATKDLLEALDQAIASW